MREAARALRGGEDDTRPADPGRATAAGRDAARALERLADRLGDAAGGRDADERRLSDQLARARDVRDRMSELQRQIEALQKSTHGEGKPGPDGQQAGATSSARSQGGQQGAASPSQGQRGEGAAGQRSAQEQLERVKREYAEQVREAARLRRELDGRQGASNGGDGGGSTPEGQLMVLSAPGTEAFKQDFSKWEVLHKDVTLGLERLEATLSQRLLERAQRDRLASGAADDAPAEYRDAVERYFRSLARPKE
jgi:hypothetical protein